MKGIEDMIFSMLGLSKEQAQETMANFGEFVNGAQGAIVATTKTVARIEKKLDAIMAHLGVQLDADGNNDNSGTGTIVDGSFRIGSGNGTGGSASGDSGGGSASGSIDGSRRQVG